VVMSAPVSLSRCTSNTVVRGSVVSAAQLCETPVLQGASCEPVTQCRWLACSARVFTLHVPVCVFAASESCCRSRSAPPCSPMLRLPSGPSRPHRCGQVNPAVTSLAQSIDLSHEQHSCCWLHGCWLHGAQNCLAAAIWYTTRHLACCSLLCENICLM
jgi:hypothetical protein